MLTVCTWLWGDAFGLDDVAKLAAGVRRNLKQPHKIVYFTDQLWTGEFDEQDHCCGFPIFDQDRHLTKTSGCFARLRLFDPGFQEAWNLGERIACIDLDTIITGPLDPLFDRSEPFVIMQGGNSVNPTPYGGALMMLRAGAHPEVWSDFSVEAAAKVPHFVFPDDQSWLHAKIPNAATWNVGKESGVYCFQKPGWPKGTTDLPDGASVVTFRGNNLPGKYTHLDWVKENWR